VSRAHLGGELRIDNLMHGHSGTFGALNPSNGKSHGTNDLSERQHQAEKENDKELS